MEGWIKIHRKMLENPIVCKDSSYLAVWIYLLLNATHKEIPALFKGKKIVLQKGQLITGRKSIAKQLQISESKVKRILFELESDQQIDRQRSNQNSLISILNWDKYQEVDQENGQQMDSQWTASGQPVTTNKNIKNDKNVKNERNNINNKIKKEIKTFDDVFKENHYSSALENALRDFIDMRKTIKKPMTTRALELLVRNLDKLTNSEPEKIAILNQSIERGWQTVYPIKTSVGKNNGNIDDFKKLWEEAKIEDEQTRNSTNNNPFGW